MLKCCMTVAFHKLYNMWWFTMCGYDFCYFAVSHSIRASSCHLRIFLYIFMLYLLNGFYQFQADYFIHMHLLFIFVGSWNSGAKRTQFIVEYTTIEPIVNKLRTIKFAQTNIRSHSYQNNHRYLSYRRRCRLLCQCCRKIVTQTIFNAFPNRLSVATQ